MAENSKKWNGLITQQIYGGGCTKYTLGVITITVALAKDT
jgi:hypothetical protein